MKQLKKQAQTISVSESYNNESISALKGADRVRLRPAVIFGSDDIHGCEHSFFEILSNSIDEAREGYGKTIRVKRFKDDSLEVEDEGRGIPVDFNRRENRYNWELVYCELYAGGKYNNASGEHYEFSLGLNGLGACATQYASSFFDVEVRRDGTLYQLHFEKGENVGGLQKEAYTGRKTGTLQCWKPDTEVFTDIHISLDYFEKILKQQAVVNAGIRFIFDDEQTGTHYDFCYPEGILAYVQELDDGKGITEPLYFESEGEGRDREDREDYKVKISLAFSFNNEHSACIYFHNSSPLEYGGSPEKATKLAFSYALDKMAKERGKYKANESKLTFSDIQDSLLIVISSFSTETSYENQTKKAINNRFIQYFLTDFLKTQLELWSIENPSLCDRVLDQILINKRSRESAERQRLITKKALMGSVDINNRIKKFVDCRSKDVTQRELYIVEGDSALGSVKLGRDADFQAVIPVRGKILNCLKAEATSIFKNEIITDLIKVLGCGVELSGKAAKSSKQKWSAFDIDALRWSKVVICTDADVDGFQIRTLILAMFYRLMPSLIRAGKVYIAQSPLFEITYSKGKEHCTLFAYDEREKAQILKRLGEKHCSLQRSKGLGENEPDMMWETTMNPDTRRLIQVQVTDEETMSQTFDLLLGDNLAGRKAFIESEGHNWLDTLDLD